MSSAADHEAVEPESFEFNAESLERAKVILARYPEERRQSAVMPLLDLAQRQYGWLPKTVIAYVADMCGMPFVRAYEVATFYTMYKLKPVGKYHLQLCRTTPCWLRGAGDMRDVVREKLGISHDEVTDDGKFSLEEVECLGGCVNAPIIQVNDDYYEDLDRERAEKLLDSLSRDEVPEHGPTVDRQTSAPETDRKTLLNEGEGA